MTELSNSTAFSPLSPCNVRAGGLGENRPLPHSIQKSLAATNWNFEKRANRPIENIHPYPAKFIGDIPGTILDLLPLPKGAIVLDPFCGSGTTLVECQSRGIPSIGVDLNPIACLISRVKTSALPEDLSNATTSTVRKAMRTKNPPIPCIPNLDHWFTEAVQSPLASLTRAIDQASPSSHDVLRLALSSILVRVSNQDSDTRYAAVKKNVRSEEVYELFARAVGRIQDALEKRPYSVITAKVIQADTLKLPKKRIPKPVGLVITSPPYPNAYEYWLYHKYRMWWLGFDPLAVKEREIGARAHFFKKNRHTSLDFNRQMEATFQLLSNVMMNGSHACFVVGRSKIHGEIVDNAETIRNVAQENGFSHVFSVDRTLSANRKSFNLSHANIKTETLVVLQRNS